MVLQRTRVFSFSLLPLFVIAHFSHHLLTAITAPLLPLIRNSFQLTYTQSGLLLSAFTVTYGLAHLPAGWLGKRIGSYPLIISGVFGVGIAGILAGFSVSYRMVLLALVCIGVFGAGYHPASTTLISGLTPPAERGKALGIHIIGGSASYFLAPLFAAGFAALWNWRSAYIGLSLPTISFGLLLWFLLRRNHKRYGDRKQEPATEPFEELPFARARLIVFLVLATVGGATVSSVIGFVSLYMVDTFGIAEEKAAGFLAIIFSAGFWVSPLAGILSDRIGKIPLMLIVGAIIGPVVYLMTLVPMGIAFYLLLMMIGVVLFVRMPVSESFIVAEAAPEIQSTVLGVYFFAASLGGGMLTPLMGVLVDHFTFRQSFRFAGLFLMLLSLVCSVLIILLSKKMKTVETESA